MSDELKDGADGAGEPGRVPDRRVLAVAGSVAALMLAGGAFLLTGGEEAADEVVFAVPRRAAVAVQPSATPTPTPTPAPTRADPENPFLAQVRDTRGDAAPAADPAGTGVVAPTGGSPADPVVVGPTATAPTSGPTGFAPGPTTTTAPAAPLPTLPPVSTSTPAPAPTTAPATSPAPAQHTLVLTRVTGTAPDLRGRFLVDGEAVVVEPGTLFGPGDAVNLVGLEETGDGWVAVLQVGTQEPRNHPLGRVLRFS